MPKFNLLEDIPEGGVSRICSSIRKLISHWSGLQHGTNLNKEVNETNLALLWGAICCFPHVFDDGENLASLMALINTFDQLLMAKDGMVTLHLLNHNCNSYPDIDANVRKSRGCHPSSFLP